MALGVRGSIAGIGIASMVCSLRRITANPQAALLRTSPELVRSQQLES